MKKIVFCALAAVALAGCAKESAEYTQVAPAQETATTRAAGDIFTAQLINEPWWQINSQNFWVDPAGNLWGMYDKGYFYQVGTMPWNPYYYLEFLAPYNEYPYPSTASCLDINGNVYIITPNNYLIKFWGLPNNESSDEAWANAVNLTPQFPAGTVFIGLSPSSDNTNVFVTTAQGTGSGNHMARYEQQDLYRVAVNGNVTKMVSNIAAPVEPFSMLPWGNCGSLQVYLNALSKANGAFVWGMDCDGNIFKAGTVNGTVQYFTPRVPVQCFTAASAKNNPYAVSGNRIYELRPSMASDVVVGTLPATVTGTPIMLLTDPDATVFYLVVEKEYSATDGSSYEAIGVYKLTL